jgi:putative FmdB family regulatory protein
MPAYDYVCRDCGHRWEEIHGLDASARDCPNCESVNIHKRITSAPAVAGGLLTHAGDGKMATKEQLQAKWAEETPKLRRKLRDRLGERALDNFPTLNHKYDE